jgi:hypothetical protein
MMKHSKKSKGAAILEPEIQAPNEIIQDTRMGIRPTTIFDNVNKIIKDALDGMNRLEPEEVGMKIYVFLPKHSKSARKLAAKQFSEGLVEKGAILLPDKQVIKFGGTCKTEMVPALKVMLRDGVFLAGKAPRRS